MHRLPAHIAEHDYASLCLHLGKSRWDMHSSAVERLRAVHARAGTTAPVSRPLFCICAWRSKVLLGQLLD